MLPRELRWEEVAPPQNWLETAAWPERNYGDVMAKANKLSLSFTEKYILIEVK